MKMLILILCGLIASPIFKPASAEAAECQHRIVFLPQSHALDEMTGAQATELQKSEIAESQWKIANYIERFPGVPVFSEQTGHEDFSMSILPEDKQSLLKAKFAQIFSQGLPDKASDLNDLQKQKLIDNGGDFVQLIRGRTQLLHRVVENKDESDKIFAPIQRWFKTSPSQEIAYPPEIGSLIYGAREQAALTQVQKFFAKNPTQRDVILIYGSNHSFQFYPDQFPAQCVVIPPDFQQDWKGRFRSGPEGFSRQPAKVESEQKTSAQR